MQSPNYQALCEKINYAVPMSVREHVELVVSRIEANEIDITVHEQDWVNIILSLATALGEEGRPFAHRVSRFYPRYNPSEVNEKFDWCLNHTQRKMGIGTFMQIAKDYDIDVSMPPGRYPEDINSRKQSAIKTQEKRKRGRPRKIRDNDEETPFIQAMQKLEEIADYRYNVINEQVEYLPKDGDGTQWFELDDREFNTLYTRIKSASIRVNKTDFESMIRSKDISAPYNPIMDYLNSLPAYDPASHQGDSAIDDLFNHLVPEDKDKQPFLLKYGRKFFLNMVALMAGRNEDNQLMLVLVGKQNAGKSHFCKHLVPPQLKEFFRTVLPNDDLKDKDLNLALSSNVLILFDEFVHHGRANQMKAFVSAGSTQIRRAYDRSAKNRVRRASIVATGNEKEYLSDLSGDRRYISIEVKSTVNFDEHPIRYDEAYAEALYLIQQPDYRPSLTKEEVEEISDNNKDFAEPNQCEESILRFFRKPLDGEVGSWYSASDIRDTILSRSSISSYELPVRSIGIAMNSLGFSMIKPQNRARYLAVIISENEYAQALLSKSSQPVSA